MTETSSLLPVAYYQGESLQKNLAIADMAYKSGLLPSTLRSPVAVLYVMQRGASLGLDPFFAAENTFFINGRLMLSVHAFQALLIKNGIRWEVKCNTAERAEVVFTRQGFAELVSVFTTEDAKRGGLAAKDSFRAWPADVIYANAFRKGARKIAPDVLMGLSYVDEVELGDTGPQTPPPAAVTVETARLEEAKRPTRAKKKQDDVSAPIVPLDAEVVEDHNLTTDNPDYHKCDSQPVENEVLCSVRTNKDHADLVRSVMDDLKIPARWRVENKDLICKALDTIRPDTAEIKACVQGLLEITGC
jgi:hypothetical protein